MGFEDWERWQQISAIIFVAVVIIGAVWWFGFQNSSSETGTPQLSFNLDNYSGIAMNEVSTHLNIINKGEGTNDLTITIESQAFETITVSPLFGVSADTTKPESIKISVNDVENGFYPVTVTYSCNGVSQSSPTPEQFYVIPNIELIEVNYLDPITGMELGDGNNIDQNGEKELSFKIRSKSQNAVYHDLYAILVVEEIVIDTITITPSTLNVGSIGPNGRSEDPFPFMIKTDSTPLGTYDLTVVLYSDDYVVASKLRTLDVV